MYWEQGQKDKELFLLSLENIRQSLEVMAQKWEKKKTKTKKQKKPHPVFKCVIKWSVRDEKMT